MTNDIKDLTVYQFSGHPRKTGALRMSDEQYESIIRFSAFKKDASDVPPLINSDHLAAIKSRLQMLGNDAAGDCEAVRWANTRLILTSALTGTPHYPSQADVWAIYKTQNPGFVPGNGPHGYGSADDGGMDTDTLCKYLIKTGGPDGVKALAYASVDATDESELELAINAFGVVWVDIVVLDDNQQQFSEGKPWTNTGGSVDGGHAVPGVGNIMVPVSSVSAFIDIATWAQETSLSKSFWEGKVQGQALVMGVYIVVWPENVGTKQFEAGVNTDTLVEVYKNATGKTLVLTPPAPTPVPNPTPTPTPVQDNGLAEFLSIEGLTDWSEERHTGMNEVVAKGVQKLVAANENSGDDDDHPGRHERHDD